MEGSPLKKLAFGFMRLPVLDETDRSTVDTEAVKKMIDRYMERGFTYFDTAHRYNDEASEPAIRDALVKGNG
jgi:predicted aldo/keto reductase-like oxidoreductase